VLLLLLSGAPHELGVSPLHRQDLVELLLLPMFVLSVLPLLFGWRRFKQSADAPALARVRGSLREPMIGGLAALVFVALWDLEVIASFGTAFGLTLFVAGALVLVRAAWLDPS